MRFKEEIYATGKQCFKGLIAAFVVVGTLLATHDILWDWICIAASFLFYGAGNVLLFIFPVLPATCLILTGFVLWLSCLCMKLSHMNKLTKTFWCKAVRTHFVALLILIVAFISWMSISNSGETLLKGAGMIGFFVSVSCTMLITMCYQDQQIKPEDVVEDATQ